MLATEMGHDDFTASNGWLQSWSARHNVKFSNLAGESADVPEDADWKRRLPEITEGYELSDIYNADETGLFYRALPSKSLVVKGDPCRGTKVAKERITVLLAC